MILIDSRVGSAHYAALLGDRAVLTQLEFGDAAFTGIDNVTVGVEIKKLSDAVQCMFTGRLVDHQLPGMAEAYDVRYLLLEGVWRPEPTTGVLQTWKEFPSQKDVVCGRWTDTLSGRKRLMYTSFSAWLTSLETLGGVKLRCTPSPAATAAELCSLESWWCREDHASFNVMQEPTGTNVNLSRPTLLRRVAALLPGVGWIRSKAVADHFGTITAMVNAAPSEWLEINGIGKGITRAVIEALGGSQ